MWFVGHPCRHSCDELVQRLVRYNKPRLDSFTCELSEVHQCAVVLENEGSRFIFFFFIFTCFEST